MRILTAIVIAVATVSPGRMASAQTATYKARLSPVPVENARTGITGAGSVTATLAGRSL